MDTRVALGNLGCAIGTIGVVNALLPVDKSLKELLSELEEVKFELEVPEVLLIQKLNRRYTWECETFLFEPLRSNCCKECDRGCEHISLDEWHKIKKLREGLKNNKEFDELCNKILEESNGGN